MSDLLIFVEIEGQYVELLPARIVMSTFAVQLKRDAGDSGGGSDPLAAAREYFESGYISPNSTKVPITSSPRPV